MLSHGKTKDRGEATGRDSAEDKEGFHYFIIFTTYAVEVGVIVISAHT